MSEDYDPLSFMPDPSQLKSGFRCSERRLYVKFQLQWFPNNHIISYIRNTMEDLSLFNDIEGLMLTMSEIDFIKSKISLYVLYALFDFDTVLVTQCLLL